MTSTDSNDYHGQNRASWNEAVVAHNSHKVDQHLFFRNKGSTLYKEEKDLLGNLAGLKVCHLQCNAGQDTLSLVSKLGAENPVGVDISDNAIDFARQLAKDAGIEATYIRSDVFDYFEATPADQFDVVFMSYGTICWLSSMQKLAAGIKKILKPGGRFCFVEFHPTGYIFNQDMVQEYPYSSAGVPARDLEGVNDYVALSATEAGDLTTDFKHTEGVKNFRNPHPSAEFSWGLADVISSFITTEMQMTHFLEYPYSNFFKIFKDMTPEKVEEGIRWYPIGPMLPLMYSLEMKKPL
ncbi:hypothetical protein BGZ51_008055 [Haplosporangium sp. Z 767]|nr:hypothetical protein BGZ51_008055 [Haplosporangium sp. Z 767]KAF9193062.1 hypothetical protein BGZ50_007910 [Haplosporangium sp. Z 11]